MRVIPWLLTLTGTIWSTGNIVLVVLAISAFSWQAEHPTLLSREAAGAVFGHVLQAWSGAISLLLLPILVALGWLCGAAWRKRRHALAAAWLGALCLTWAVHAVNHSTVIEADRISANIRELRALPPEQQGPLPSLEQRFSAVHHSSERWHTVESLVALGLVIGGSIALLRRPAQRPASPEPSAA